MLAPSCHILRLKCTKFDFGWGSVSDPAGGAHSAPPDSLTGFGGVLLLREGKGMGAKGKEGGRGRKGRKGGRKGREKGREEKEGKGKVASWLLGGWTPLNVQGAVETTELAM